MPEQDKPRKRKILVVDDNGASLGLMSYCIGRGGHEVLEAVNAEDAFSIVSGVENLDLVIVDYVMPGANGLDFIKKARNQGIRVAIWLTSEYLTKHIEILAFEYGADKAIGKSDLIPTLQKEGML